MAFILKAMGFSDAIPNFPFTPIESSSTLSASSTSTSAPYRAVADIAQRHIGCSSSYSVQMVNGVTWTVRPGHASDDKKKLVSIFTCHYGNNSRTAELARNAVKRAKSLVLPGFLKVHGAADYQDTAHIATDPCVPLKQVLSLPAARHFFFSASYHTEEDTRMGIAEDTESYREALALGLRGIAGALNSLHRNHLIHGNVCADTVFVLSTSGAWRLFGLELVSTAGEPNGLYYAQATSVLPRGRVPPEVQQGRRDLVATLNVGHADAWGLGLLIAQSAGVSAAEAAQGRLDDVEVQAGTTGTLLTPAQLRDQLPKDLSASYQELTAPSPLSRMTLPAFLDKTALLLNSQLVHSYAELEEISLRDQGQRERFFDHLNVTSQRFPFRFCLCALVAKLVESLQTGVVANVVQPIAHIASRMPKAATTKSAPADGTPATIVDYDFDVFLTPAFTALYQSADNLVRYRLLEHAALYAPQVPSKTASEVIWPLYARGFTSQAASVREYSARALVHLAPRLTPAILQKDVPQHLSTLQRDGDGAIRTNATICLCLVAPFLPESGRGAILMNGFCRMLKDPFAPSRIAALRSLASTLRYVDASSLAQLALPAVCPLMVDADADARGCALTIVQSSLEKLQAADVQRRQEDAARPPDASDTAGTAGPPTTATTNSTAVTRSSGGHNNNNTTSSSLLSGLTTWMGGTTTTPHASPTPAPAGPAPSAGSTRVGIGAATSASPFSTSMFTTHADPGAAPPIATTTTTGKSGWSEDDEGGDSAWGTGGGNVDDLFVSTATQSKTKPATTANPAKADFSSLFEGMAVTTPSPDGAGGASSGAPMKLRGKKGGGFGATRL